MKFSKKKSNTYHANEMISYNNNKNVAVVLQVHDYYLKVINQDGHLQNIKISDIDKKFERENKVNGMDRLGNTLCLDNVVKVVDGRNKGRKGVIKHIFKKTLFLWDKEFAQSNGLYVEQSSNVQILGQEFMKGKHGGTVASQNRRGKDKLEG